MSAAVQRWRFVLFCASCAALVAAALGFADYRHRPAPGAPPLASVPPPATPAPPRSAANGVAGLRTRLAGAARRFLSAFFHYEVGELGPRVRRTLRSTATPGFAAELLGAPPRAPPRSPPDAIPGRLAIAAVSVLPPRALISGSARRGEHSEQFSFLFEARHGAWLASGPGE